MKKSFRINILIILLISALFTFSCQTVTGLVDREDQEQEQEEEQDIENEEEDDPYSEPVQDLTEEIIIEADEPEVEVEVEVEVEEPEPIVEEEEPIEVVEEPICDQPIKIGLITDSSGPLSIYGTQIIQSFMLGMEYATGAPGSAGDGLLNEISENSFLLDGCEVIVYIKDDESNTDLVAATAYQLVDEYKVDVLVGTVSSAATLVLQDIAAEKEVVLIAAPASASEITGENFNEYSFRTSHESYQDALAICEYLSVTDDSFVLLAPDYSFGWANAAAFRDACSMFGGTFPIDDIFLPLDTTGFSPYMQEVLESGADALLLTWVGSEFDSLITATKNLGVMDQMSISTIFVDNTMMPIFFPNAIGVTGSLTYHYTAPDNPVNDWMVDAANDRYGIYPDLYYADGFNAAIMVVEALRKTDFDTTSEALIDALEGMEFEGPKGMVYIRPEDHVAIQDMYILSLLNVVVPDARFFDLLATLRPEPPCLLPGYLDDRCGDLPIGSLTGE